LLLAVPLWVLYELGIICASMMSKAKESDAALAAGPIPEKVDGEPRQD
jgi:Sec-independent protein secretion pathway component TatC